MNRFLTFHTHGTSNNEQWMSPAYYMDGDYEPVAVRIHVGKAPAKEAKIDIYDDGVSLFNNSTTPAHHHNTGTDLTGDAVTYMSLAAGQNSDEVADDFTNDPIDSGSWITCKLLDAGSGANFTVQLEIALIEEDE